MKLSTVCRQFADKAKLIFVGKPSEFKKIHKENTLEKAFVTAIT